jgi:hydroxyethylthiazole kinase-like uncharacterized protein yjeF
VQKIFDEVSSLDQRCYEQFSLSEDILMEHAASSMYQFIKNRTDTQNILIVCGPGNNGADGIALGRLLHKESDITLLLTSKPKSNMGKLQLKRCQLLGVNIEYSLEKRNYSMIIDCIFGSGLTRELDSKITDLINSLNQINAYKIACDIPTGININGQILKSCFQAHTTITMGALKKSLFSDDAKNYVGNIEVANLGIARKIYETSSKCFLLEKSDLVLPFRKNRNTNKGTFGHVAVIAGEKNGAAILSSDAAFNFGAGLVTLVSKKEIENAPHHIMQNKKLPDNTNTLCVGMGLGDKISKKILALDIPKVIDADLFYNKAILKILKQDNIVLTPHPKEFCSLLKLTKIANVDVKTLQENRFYYVSIFTSKFPNVVLLLKGANVIISQDDKMYINTFGTNTLSKGGSGDVLSGMIAALLAQNYTPLEAVISGSLAHTLALRKMDINNYALNPKDIIEVLKYL